jgi:hypothetical protein
MIIAPKTGLLVPLPMSRQPMPAFLVVEETDPNISYWTRRLRADDVQKITAAQAKEIEAKVAAARQAKKAAAHAPTPTADDKVASDQKGTK